MKKKNYHLEMVVSNQLTSPGKRILKCPDLHRQVHSHHYLNKIKKTNKKNNKS